MSCTTTSSHPVNRAAWIDEVGKPLQVREAPYPDTIGPDEVVVRNRAVGLAIVDYYHQYLGIAINAFPHVAGTDSAGVIEAVGSAVSPSVAKPGDRVLCCSKVFRTSNPADGTFQLYTVTDSAQVTKLPDSMSFVEGAVLPLSVSTAIAGLFQNDTMALPLPPLQAVSSSDAASEEEKVVFISGGTTSVALSALQILQAAGYTVAVTASPKHQTLLTSLGVRYIFDRSSATLADDVVEALKGKNVVGVFETVGGFAGEEQAPLVMASKVANALGVKAVVTINPRAQRPAALPEAVQLRSLIAVTPFTTYSKVGKYIFGEWMEGALQNGTLRPLPEPLVVGKGLEAIHAGILRVKEGVSGQKVVVELP